MKKKKAKPGKPANEESRPSIFAGKKKKIAGIIIILFSIFIILSILSYSRFDKANLSYSFSDLFKAFGSNSDFNHKADSTRNWLGIFGAYISDFFINSTLGISSIIFPVLVLAWGFSLFSKIEYRKLINASNFVLIAGLIVSTLFGIFRTHFQIFPDIYELSGSVGDYLGISLSHLLGGVGSTIFLFTIAIILLVVAFDIKIENVFHYLQSLFVGSTEDDSEETAAAPNVEEDDSNLKKIKELGKKKKKLFAKEKTPTSEELQEEEAKEQTRIRIIRKDEPPVKQTVNESSKEDKKREEPKKAVDSTAKEIDKDKEAELPNNWEEKISYKKPGLDLLEPIPKENFKVAEEELKRNAELLKEKLKLFDIDIKDISVTPGPVVTLYEIVPAPGVKISRIVGLEHDIALALAARGIRIIAPIPGKSAIGVEIPNTKASLVNARSVLSKMPDTNFELPIALGMQINGEVYVTDLAKMPHMLIAGSTGSGKSVSLNSMICSILFKATPGNVRF
ncbi:MAG: DNA translocase FtsK 4TM domain-containing protein, partial [Bacteroidota bacterium]|nr:DNA translocase FtsK 4TM domain-containing protein [Bacteroidota bacterium]